MSDASAYDTWLKLLASHGSPKPNSAIGAGFWRLPSSKGHARPVATWVEEGEVWVVDRPGVEKEPFDSEKGRGKFLAFMADGWPKLEAWGQEVYENAVKSGVWPDNVPTGPKPVTPEVANPKIGDNEPPDDNTLDDLIARLDALVAEATKVAKAGPATTKEEADSASNLKARIRGLRQEIVGAHRVAKGPIIAEGKRIDAAYFVPRDRATTLEARLHEVRIAPFLKEQQRLRDEERARLSAEKASGKDVGAMPDAKVRVGATGMSTSLRTRWIGTITNYEEFYGAVADHDEVRRFIIDYAQRIASNIHKIGANIAGLETKEEKY